MGKNTNFKRYWQYRSKRPANNQWSRKRIHEHPKTTQSASNSISEKQMGKIVENLKNKADKIKDYPVFQDWLSDRELHNK